MSESHDHTTPLLATGVLLLAAGFSRRFGAVKLGATLQNGETVIAVSYTHLRAHET